MRVSVYDHGEAPDDELAQLKARIAELEAEIEDLLVECGDLWELTLKAAVSVGTQPHYARESAFNVLHARAVELVEKYLDKLTS